MSAAELAPGLWRWTERHPDWHPGEFGAEVASFALVAGDDLLLIDPLLPDEDEEDGADADADAARTGVLTTLDGLAAAAQATTILITIGYHVRSSALLSERYGARVHGPKTVASRLADTEHFTVLEPGVPGPGGATAHAIGRPRRSELPLWLPSHAAVAFGDALVTTPDGELRLWCQESRDPDRIAFYRDRFAPTLAPLRELPAQRILTTHGAPILTDGASALATALDAEPWFHHG